MAAYLVANFELTHPRGYTWYVVIAAKAFDLQTNLRILDAFARDAGKVA